jgi:predicted transcriptional regulator
VTEQLSIFDPPRARRADPDTSHQAAEQVAEFACAHYSLIWAALRAPFTIYELAERTGLTHVQCARRLPEMEALGHVVVTEERRPGPSGRMCRVWERSCGSR